MFVKNNFAKRKIQVKRTCVPRAEINIFIDANKFWVGKSQMVEVYIRVDIKVMKNVLDKLQFV